MSSNSTGPSNQRRVIATSSLELCILCVFFLSFLEMNLYSKFESNAHECVQSLMYEWEKMRRQKQTSYFAWVCFHNKSTYLPQTQSSYFNSVALFFPVPKTTCAQLKCVYSSWSIRINVAFSSSNNKRYLSKIAVEMCKPKILQTKQTTRTQNISAKCLSSAIFERNNAKATTARNVVQMSLAAERER